MKEPRGEQIGLDFYFRHPRRVDAFAQLVRYCCKHGGRFAGEVLESEGIGARNHKYTSLADRPVRELSIGMEDLERKLEDEDTDVIKVAMLSATGITNDDPEVISYCGASLDAAQADNPSIAIVAEGWVFSTPGYEDQAIKAGKRCFEKFVEICDALDPAYAAILNEDSLPCSFDLALGKGTRCFTDFFVSGTAYNPNTIAAVEALYKDAYTQKLRTGIYVSTWSMYNPPGLAIHRRVSLERSARVAELLGRK